MENQTKLFSILEFSTTSSIDNCNNDELEIDREAALRDRRANQVFTYPIVETFHSIQGEGAWTGVNAFFIRLGGCDVYCPWCDQKESWNAKRHPQKTVTQLTQEVAAVKPAIVIITGGEPLMHNLDPLTEELQNLGWRVHLETSGAHPFSGQFDWVTFSPKRFKQPHSSIYDRADELKIVVVDDRDLQWAQEQANLVSARTLKYLQPEWDSPTSEGATSASNAEACVARQDLIFAYVLQHPEWRISLQTHKFLQVR